MEVWKSIEGAPFYEVSNLGRVRSIDREVTVSPKGKTPYTSVKKGRVLRLSTNKYGYYTVSFYLHTGKEVTKTVHRLVAEAFIPNPENKPTVNHIDGDIKNNKVDNLEWATMMEQMIHAAENNLMAKKLKSQKIRVFGKDGTHVGDFISQKQCAIALGFPQHQARISECLLGKGRKSYKGYRFERIG